MGCLSLSHERYNAKEAGETLGERDTHKADLKTTILSDDSLPQWRALVSRR